MASPDVTRAPDSRIDSASPGGAKRLLVETKAAVKTTELYVLIATVVGILIAAAVTKAGNGHDDRFISRQAWLYISILAVGYMLSRGLAKSGSGRDDADGRGYDGRR
jgi:hypothetical protein